MVSQCGFDVHFNFACFQCFEMDSMVKKKKERKLMIVFIPPNKLKKEILGLKSRIGS